MYDLIIVGGGPAGVAAGVYAARKRLKTLLITESFGGQSTESVGVENWIGTIKISGLDLGKALEEHLRAYAGEWVEVKTGVHAERVSKEADGFAVHTADATYQARAVLITTGSSRRKLAVPGAKEYENKGLTYCASCDGPLFVGADVAVVGGGNAGFESAAQLLAYARSVTLITQGEFRADPSTVEKVLLHPSMKAFSKARPTEVKGEKFVKALVYEDLATHEMKELTVSGIFVEVGLMPATAMVEGLVPMNQYKQITTDPRNQRTQVEGIWAAGDCTDGLYHQNNIAAGDAVRALEDIYLFLKA